MSIVIPTYGRPRQLAECLRSLVELDYPRERLEVLVVDDGGPARLDEAVSPYRSALDLSLLRQDNAGPAVARNTAAAQARGDYLVFTDDDCVIDPGWLRGLADVWSEFPDAMVGGLTLNAAPGLCSATSQLIVDVVYRHYNADPRRARFLASNNMGMPLQGYREIGGFDPAFRTAEDRDFCDRWLHAGKRIIFAPAALVHHVRPMNVATFCRQHFRYGRGAEQFRRRRAERGSGSMLVESRFHLDLKNWLWYPLTRVPGRRVAPVAALIGLWQLTNLAGFVWAVVQRKVHGHDDGIVACSR